jgi:predicted Rossmann fold flavoprotein
MTPASATSSIASKASISTHHDVIIIGAGASGLMCAAEAGARGKRVLVLEGSNKVGKKILMSGGGRCNFTNLYTAPKNFLSNNPHFCISALKRYTPHDFMALVEKHGIAYEERKHGQLFCVNSAKDILTMLLAECAAYGVEIRTHCKVQSVSAPAALQRLHPLEHSVQTAEKASLFTVNASLPEDEAASWTSTSLVVATGGLSIPSMGASGLGYDIARQFGHSVLPTRAGLVPFTFSDGFVGEQRFALPCRRGLRASRSQLQRVRPVHAPRPQWPCSFAVVKLLANGQCFVHRFIARQRRGKLDRSLQTAQIDARQKLAAHLVGGAFA